MNVQTKPNPTQLIIFVRDAHVLPVQSTQQKIGTSVVPLVHPDGIVGCDASLTNPSWILFEESYEQG